MKTSLYILIAIASLSFASIAQAMPVDQVPNPREGSNSFVQDTAGVLGPNYSSLIDSVSKELESKTGAELAVVTVDGLDGLTVEEYAERLFKRFGIGKRDRDNGLLLIFSLGDRKVRIEVGYGLEGIMNDAKAGRILDEDAVPFFKLGEYGRGLFLTASAVASEIAKGEGAVLELPLPSKWPTQVELPAAAGSALPPGDIRSGKIVDWLVGYAVFMLVATAISFIFTVLRVRSKRARAARKLAMGNGAILPLVLWVVGGFSIYAIGIVSGAVLLPILVFASTAIGLSFAHFAFRSMMKGRVGSYALACPSCGEPMQLVDDITDNRYLEDGEVAEERAGGMEYEFWRCDSCDRTERLEVVLHDASPCPKCSRRTLKRRVELLRSATTSSEGLERIHFECKNPSCGYERAEERRIPKKSSSRSGGGSSGSSGGSSFGGGSSGGGGASRGW